MFFRSFGALLILTVAVAAGTAQQPLALHPDNPHYFLFRNRPTILVTSGEHYGAVLNLDFDSKKYLATLAADGLNLTRTFPGCYVEPEGAFKIERNTLAPAPGKLICPWPRSSTPGYLNGGNRFDLSGWDDAFFRRLKDFVSEASKSGIVVELSLFTPMYEDAQWNYSPIKASNNVNGIGKVGKHQVYTIDKEPALLAVQDAMVRKIVTELNGFDNLYYEVCNEPYFGGVTRAWHDHITDVIVATEKTLPKKHLISWNVANDYARVRDPHPAISIFNFHYAEPRAAADNYALNKVLGLNETGFKGTGDDYYRMQAWEYLLAGGALYNNLDYSFCVGHEDGTFGVEAPTPGGGGPRLRQQLRLLADFLNRFDFLHMKPARSVLKGGVPGQIRFQVLAESGKQYAVYLRSSKDVALQIELPPGEYEGEWLDAVSTRRNPVPMFDHPGGVAQIKPPEVAQDCALRLTAQNPARKQTKTDLDELRRAAMNNGGNAARGKIVFASTTAKCAVCHKVHGQGGDVGPDLSQIGGKFDRTHLIESTLDPSAEIPQGFHSTIIETKSGRVVTGIVKSESATEVTLLDAEAKRITIPLRDIEARALSKISLMPTGLVDGMTPAQFTDLMAYLESLHTGRKPTPGEGVNGALTLPPGFNADVVVTGLTGATALEVPADGRIFVCEQTGALRVVKNGKLLGEPFVKLPVEATWERGLIGVTVAPDFPKTPHVFVCYVAARPYPHHVVSRFIASGDVALPGSERILLEGDDQTKLGGDVPAGHQGGAIHFGKDGKLYIAIGDQTAGKPAQDLHSLLGKLLRVNPGGSIPDDNPFVQKTTGKYRAIWTLGLRNPFTFAVQPETGRLFINDVGGIAEEINEGVAGANYGWPIVEHGPTTDPRFRGPIHHYPTACIAGGAFAPADLKWPKEYRGQYFVGDFNHGWIKTLDPAKPAEARTFATGLRRPVDLRFAADGNLYVLLRDAWVIDKLFKGGTGTLLRIQSAAARPSSDYK